MTSNYVVIDCDKECRMCGSIISSGTKCYEVEVEDTERFWICCPCVDIENEIAVTESNIEASYMNKKIIENIRKLMKMKY